MVALILDGTVGMRSRTMFAAVCRGCSADGSAPASCLSQSSRVRPAAAAFAFSANAGVTVFHALHNGTTNGTVQALFYRGSVTVPKLTNFGTCRGLGEPEMRVWERSVSCGLLIGRTILYGRNGDVGMGSAEDWDLIL